MNDQIPGKPVVVSKPGFLALLLGDGNFQSLMRKSRPHRLELGYTRTMMGFLLFNPQPRHIAMIGLGGGSIPKYCYRHLRDSRITTVEIDPEVIALREHFHIPADNERFRIVCADGADFVAMQKETLDVLLVDGFDTQGQAPQLCSQKFYDDCCASLSVDGVLVVNVLGADTEFEVYLARIRQSFGGKVMVAPSEDCANRIIFAVKGKAIDLPESKLMARAISLESCHGLKFQLLVEWTVTPRKRSTHSA